MRRVGFEIDEVTFEHACVGLERQLSQFDGVVDVRVDVPAHRVNVTYDEERFTLHDLGRLIDECGYRCRAFSAPEEAEAPSVGPGSAWQPGWRRRLMADGGPDRLVPVVPDPRRLEIRIVETIPAPPERGRLPES